MVIAIDDRSIVDKGDSLAMFLVAIFDNGEVSLLPMEDVPSRITQKLTNNRLIVIINKERYKIKSVINKERSKQYRI